MPETIACPVVALGDFSDELLKEILRQMTLCGESPIAELAHLIRNLRKLKIPLESAITRKSRDAYLQMLCLDLHQELLRIGAIDAYGRLNFAVLRGCLARK